MNNQLDILSMTLPQLCEQLVQMGQPKFRAKQIYEWLFKRRVQNFADMNNLPLALRNDLQERFFITSFVKLRHQVSQKDGTNKFLYELPDGQMIESVFMRYHHGNSLCISSQVGCKMGCKFCASTLQGLMRNLTPGEMLMQVMQTEREMNDKVNSIVLMGIGEPLDNFENVLQFLKILNSPEALNMSLRHVSLSTCGVVPRIYDLAKENLQLTLSISLHAPNDDIRNQMMPVNRRYPIAELLTACEDYIQQTGRRISFEYALSHGVNDTPQCAHELGKRLSRMLCHVNLIPINPVVERSFLTSERKRIEAFQSILEGYHIPVTVRRTLGTDIDAACGQLRSKAAKEGGQQSR